MRSFRHCGSNPISCFTLFKCLGHKLEHIDRCLKSNDKIPKIELALRMKTNDAFFHKKGLVLGKLCLNV